jgi:hypothetical protein
MERQLKVLYYRGIRYTAQLLAKRSNQLKELTYRGVTFISNASSNRGAKSHATMQYRGVAY